MLFKVKAEKTQRGNSNVATTCKKGHTSYKKSGDTKSEYVCPYCGLDVP